MSTGAITQYIDVAQIVLYMFWIFFAGLIFYLHRENKREGYPLETEGGGRVVAQGFPSMPSPKTYLLRSGRVVMAPDAARDNRAVSSAAVPYAGHMGAPLMPTGNPMLDGIGPGAYAMRPDTVDLTVTDQPRIVPLRVAAGFGPDVKDIDPRGLPVIGADGVSGGIVVDLWVDRAEAIFRYIELQPSGGAGPVLLPINFARIKARSVRVDSILGSQFAAVPRTKTPDQITMLEEERVMAYYGAGTLYATAARSEPLL